MAGLFCSFLYGCLYHKETGNYHRKAEHEQQCEYSLKRNKCASCLGLSLHSNADSDTNFLKIGEICSVCSEH